MAIADDIVIFGEATLPNIQHMVQVIEDIFHASGQQINFAKSQIFYLKGLDQDIVHSLFQ